MFKSDDLMKTLQLSTLYSLISIMLSRFRMSVDQALEQYRTLGNTVFGSPRFFHTKTGMVGKAKYDAALLETAIEDVTKSYCWLPNQDFDNGRFASRPDLCKT